MQHSNDGKIDRRSFLTAGAVVAGSAIASTALSYGRILGANDRIALGPHRHRQPRQRAAHDGVAAEGQAQRRDRGRLRSLEEQPRAGRGQHRAVLRPRAAGVPAPRGAAGAQGRRRRRHRDAGALALADAEGGGRGRQGRLLREADGQRARGGQGGARRRQASASSSCRSARSTAASRTSWPRARCCAAASLGDVSKYEIVWNYNGPRWRGRPEVKQIREQDTDWKKWLMTKPDRPFDPQLYFEFRLYREFSSGIPDQWMSHGIDLVHFFMNEQPPRSVVAHGGVFAWHDGRENPDTFQALVEYPTFLASYSTSFGNDCDSFSRIMGKKATLVNIGGEGSPRWKVVEEKGNHEDNPDDRSAPSAGSRCRATTSPARSTSATRTCRTCRTGSSACAAATRRRTPPSTTASCTRWRASWRRSRTGRASGCITIRAEQITDSAPGRS